MSWSIRTHLQRCFIPDDLRHAHLQIFCKVKSLRSAFLCFRRCRIVYFFVGGSQKSFSFVPTCTNIIKWSFEQENTISCARLGLLCDGTKNLAPPSGAGFLNAIIPVSIDEDACGSWAWRAAYSRTPESFLLETFHKGETGVCAKRLRHAVRVPGGVGVWHVDPRRWVASGGRQCLKEVIRRRRKSAAGKWQRTKVRRFRHEDYQAQRFGSRF